MYLFSLLFKTSFLLPHLFRNVKLELSQLILHHRTVVRDFNKRRQLGFATLKGNFVVKLKSTPPALLNSNDQFTFVKTKSSHSSGIVVYPPKFELLRN